MASHKRIATNEGEGGTTSVNRSKNFGSRRDLKELIFVDTKAFAANIEFVRE